MSKYLLEVGVEELPYKFIPMAISQLKSGFETFLNNSNVKFDKVNVMATPRRLAVLVEGLAASQPDVEKVVKGPIAKVAFDENNNLTKAGEGFAKKNGVTADELYVDVSKNGGVHLKIDDIMQDLREIKHNKTNVYLMHIDDRTYVYEKCNGEFEIK